MIYKDANEQLQEFIDSCSKVIDEIVAKQKQLKKEKSDQMTKDHYINRQLNAWFNVRGRL